MEDVKEFQQNIDKKYCHIYGGIAMPSEKAAGFAVVIGETFERGYLDKSKYVFLDEVEEWDARKLIRSVCGLDYRYRCDQWLGNTTDPTLDRFLREVNAELTTIEQLKAGNRKLNIRFSGLLFCEHNYSWIVPILNDMLGGEYRDKSRRRLFIEDGTRLINCMKTPQIGTAATLNFGDLPPIDALSFAIFGLKDAEDRRNRPQNLPQFAESGEVSLTNL